MCNCRELWQFNKLNNMSVLPHYSEECTMRSARHRYCLRRLDLEALGPHQMLDGGVPARLDLARTSRFYQDVFLPPRSVAR